MPLPTCACVAGLPTQQQLGNIYCALLEILAGQGGGEITLSQISDLESSWITPLQAPITPFGASVVAGTPDATGFLTTDAGGLLSSFPQANLDISVAQIIDATPAAKGLLISLPIGDASGSFVTVDDAGGSNVRTVPFSGSGLTNVNVDMGLVTGGT